MHARAPLVALLAVTAGAACIRDPTEDPIASQAETAHGREDAGNELDAAPPDARHFYDAPPEIADSRREDTADESIDAAGPLWDADAVVSPRDAVAAEVLDPAACLPSVDVGGTCGAAIPRDARELLSATTFALAARLPDGRVLLVGGSYPWTLVQIYDPDCDRWAAGPPTTRPRQRGWPGSEAVVLDDGQILVVGDPGTPGFSGQTSERYDPISSRWTAPAVLPGLEHVDEVAKLGDGRVIAAGTTSGPHLAHAIYDPSTDTWSTFDGPLVDSTKTSGATALATLGDGTLHEVYAENMTLGDPPIVWHAARWDPTAGTWTARSVPAKGAGGRYTILLPDGRVAWIAYDAWTSTVYDPSTDSYKETYARTPLFGTATLLPCGDVLLLGSGKATLWDPITDTLSDAPLGRSREGAAATVLSDGRVLVAGGALSGAYDGYLTCEMRR